MNEICSADTGLVYNKQRLSSYQPFGHNIYNKKL